MANLPMTQFQYSCEKIIKTEHSAKVMFPQVDSMGYIIQAHSNWHTVHVIVVTLHTFVAKLNRKIIIKNKYI